MYVFFLQEGGSSIKNLGEYGENWFFSHTHTVKYYSEIERKKQKTRMNLTCILLREWIQSEEATHCMTPFLWHSGTGKSEMVNRLWGGGLKYSLWYLSDRYLSLCISLNSWIFTTQQVNQIFKCSYSGYGSVIGWKRECAKESDLEMYERKPTVGGGTKGTCAS